MELIALIVLEVKYFQGHFKYKMDSYLTYLNPNKRNKVSQVPNTFCWCKKRLLWLYNFYGCLHSSVSVHPCFANAKITHALRIRSEQFLTFSWYFSLKRVKEPFHDYWLFDSNCQYCWPWGQRRRASGQGSFKEANSLLLERR